MKNCWTRIGLTALLLQLAVTAQAQDVKAPLAKLELKAGDSIVFLGDSITHQRLYTQYVEDYFYTRMPHMRLKLHNAGVGGARAWDALARFDDDVAAYKPKYVTILLGMNDGTYRPYHDETFQTYRKDMTELLARLQGIGATPIVMTPTMFDARAARSNPRNQRDEDSKALYNSVLTYYGTWLRELAAEQGLGFVDMWGPLNNLTIQQRKTDPKFTLIKDAVHPDAPGQLVMAVAIINDLGLPRKVSGITLSKSADGKWTSKAVGGKLTDLQPTDTGLSFTWAGDSLPWVVPDDAALGVKLTALGHRLSQESLEVHGLSAGKYTLKIDDQEIGTYTADQLGRHIELQANTKTPQYQQAAQVAALNKQRNEGPIGKLRGEWSRFQAFARTRRDAQAAPDNAELQAQLKKLEEGMVGQPDRVAQANKDAQAIEDEIFKINQPQPHKYALIRVE